MIPIPIVGTLIGSFTASTLLSIIKKQINTDENGLRDKLEKIYNDALIKVKGKYQELVNNILNHFKELDDLTKAEFDCQLNIDLRIENSIELARAYGVSEEDLLLEEAYFLD